MYVPIARYQRIMVIAQISKKSSKQNDSFRFGYNSCSCTCTVMMTQIGQGQVWGEIFYLFGCPLRGTSLSRLVRLIVLQWVHWGDRIVSFVTLLTLPAIHLHTDYYVIRYVIRSQSICRAVHVVVIHYLWIESTENKFSEIYLHTNTTFTCNTPSAQTSIHQDVSKPWTKKCIITW